MTHQECDHIFLKAHIRSTAIRRLIYESIIKIQDTFSMSDLETILETVDRSTIFRTLTLFSEHHLIHCIDDGSGQMKYCVCHNLGECKETKTHVHFYCEICKKTYCLDNTQLPSISVPPGFITTNINYVIKGICAKCAKKA